MALSWKSSRKDWAWDDGLTTLTVTRLLAPSEEIENSDAMFSWVRDPELNNGACAVICSACREPQLEAAVLRAWEVP